MIFSPGPSRNLECVNLLLNAGADFNRRDNFGRSALWAFSRDGLAVDGGPPRCRAFGAFSMEKALKCLGVVRLVTSYDACQRIQRLRFLSIGLPVRLGRRRKQGMGETLRYVVQTSWTLGVCVTTRL